MKYGVIVCPRCGMAKGVETNKKTTTCQCGREIKLRRMKLRFQTDSPMELAGSVARANAAIRGGEQLPSEKRPRKREPYSVIAERSQHSKDPVDRMQLIAQALTDLKGEFTEEDLGKVLHAVGKGSPKDMIAKLQQLNLIYETGEGKFRSV
ncbi:MAG: hypothetical protein A3K60_07530 [Euryarchaeota archaeon RBG_19FT_COMBO_56_21]|nr:MAG: hypothetical protein A3K60_07530 [Euryarchaeota archaeon RBG_19FT_COMBO_56_21]